MGKHLKEACSVMVTIVALKNFVLLLKCFITDEPKCKVEKSCHLKSKILQSYVISY